MPNPFGSWKADLVSTITQPTTDPLTNFSEDTGQSTIKYLDRVRAHPFVKWPGGKRTLVPEIVKVLPESFGDYWEPFVGGAAVFFALDSRIRKAHLSDLNLDLTITYQAIRKHTENVISALREHASKHSSKYYLAVRKSQPQDPAEVAARLIYLNKTCYNGLYRVNKKGQFNVPIGSHSNPKICDVENLRNVAEVLGKASIRRYSFSRIEPKPGDLVYCDPPYDGGFTSYTGEGFGNDAQKALRDRCVQWASEGVHVIVSNSNTPFVRRLFGGGGGGEPL